MLRPEHWVQAHCESLYRYALARVSQPHTAQDLVQETFLAAWRSADRFAGRASERTWLFRILRNKIADHYRRQRPEFTAEGLAELADLEAKQFSQTGVHKGSWTRGTAPRHWTDAAQCMEHEEFWKVVRECTGKLPPKVATAFLLREMDDLSSDEICETLQINRNHLGVLLHRARLALRRCLELRWFRNPA